MRVFTNEEAHYSSRLLLMSLRSRQAEGDQRPISPDRLGVAQVTLTASAPPLSWPIHPKASLFMIRFSMPGRSRTPISTPGLLALTAIGC